MRSLSLASNHQSPLPATHTEVLVDASLPASSLVLARSSSSPDTVGLISQWMRPLASLLPSQAMPMRFVSVTFS